jgi:hypothetical protein
MASIDKVISDYRKFIDGIKDYSEKKVEDTVSTISSKTNSKYSSDDTDQRVQLRGNATGFRLLESKNSIDGYAFAIGGKELIYLEFGTRQSHRGTLSIRGGFESDLDTNKIAAPYKIDSPFYHKQPIIGRYYFLNTIDEEGIRFIKDFGK